MTGLALYMAGSLAWAGRCGALDIRSALTCSSVIQDTLTAQTPNNISGPYVCPQEHLQSGGEHVYSFTCQQSGSVHLLLEDLECDLDIYILDASCDTRQGCVGESVAGSDSSDEVTFNCRAGQTYTVIIEGYGFQEMAAGRCSASGAGSYTLRFDVSDETGGCKELCSDGRDNDRDGQIDCDDDDCSGEAGCQPSGPVIDAAGLPRLCLVGERCAGSASADQGDRLIIGDEGTRIAEGAVSGVSAQVTYSAPGQRQWTVHVLGPNGQPQAAVTHVVTVEQPLRLVGPDVLNFGTVDAGTATFREGHCQALDLSSSTGMEGHFFSLDYTSPSEGCLAEPVFRGGRSSRPIPTHLPLSGYALGSAEELCLMVPACAGETVTTAQLTITPQDTRYADQTKTITLQWAVEGRSWLSCNAWWLIIIALLLFTAWVLAGIVRPARFPHSASISLAGSQKGLRRTAPQVIREVRGSRSGFYRDARVGVHADGSVNGRTKGALFRIRAHRRHGLIIEAGPVELMDRRSRKWEAPEDLAKGHVPNPSATYRAGELWFRIEL